MVIKTHRILDRLLSLLISEALPVPHALEIGALTFALRLDLAIALGRVPPASRPLLRKLNSIRNRVAHSVVRLTRSTVRDTYNCLSRAQRAALKGRPFKNADTLHALRQCYGIAFVELAHAVRRVRDSKSQARALNAIVKELLSSAPPEVLAPSPDDPDTKLLAAAVEADRQVRAKKGRL